MVDLRLSHKFHSVLTLTALALIVMTGCKQGPRPGGEDAPDYDFATVGAFDVTGGDSQQAGLTAFESDRFLIFFREAVINEMSKSGLIQSDVAPDLHIRYTLTNRLIVTASEADTRRLIWRGQSSSQFKADELSEASVAKLVHEALNGAPFLK